MVYPFVRGLKDNVGQHFHRMKAFKLETDKKSEPKLLKQESQKLNWKIVKKILAYPQLRNKWLKLKQQLNTKELLYTLTDKFFVF